MSSPPDHSDMQPKPKQRPTDAYADIDENDLNLYVASLAHGRLTWRRLKNKEQTKDYNNFLPTS